MNGQCRCRESRIATNMSILQRLDARALPIGRRSLCERESSLVSLRRGRTACGTRPFEERRGYERYATPQAPEERVQQTFCGT